MPLCIGALRRGMELYRCPVRYLDQAQTQKIYILYAFPTDNRICWTLLRREICLYIVLYFGI